MNRAFKLLIATTLTIAVLPACNKSYKCICAGGVVFEEFEKEVRAPNKEKATEKCEADNQPPTSPDVINCGLAD